MKKQIEKLEQQISHEETMLENWANGDNSTKPENWTQHEQSILINGMKYALDIIKETNTEQDKGVRCNKCARDYQEEDLAQIEDMRACRYCRTDWYLIDLNK
jgi:hypothetical protein